MKKLSTDNSIDAQEASYLYVKPSQLTNAGNGLFTAIDIYKDEVISLFKGAILSTKQITSRVLKNKDAYFIQMLDGTIMDSMQTACYAKYANDANGFSKSNFTNNAKIIIDENGDVCIVATKHIKMNTEIFCSYGKAYWKKHSKIIR